MGEVLCLCVCVCVQTLYFQWHHPVAPMHTCTLQIWYIYGLALVKIIWHRYLQRLVGLFGRNFDYHLKLIQFIFVIFVQTPVFKFFFTNLQSYTIPWSLCFGCNFQKIILNFFWNHPQWCHDISSTSHFVNWQESLNLLSSAKVKMLDKVVMKITCVKYALFKW